MILPELLFLSCRSPRIFTLFSNHNYRKIIVSQETACS